MAELRRLLVEHLPFSQMAAADLDYLLAHVEVAYFGPGETVLAPEREPPTYFFIVKQGRVRGVAAADGKDNPDATTFEATVGESFPAGALLANRPVILTYVASADTFCLRLPRAHFDELTRRGGPFLDHCKRRLGVLLDQSRRQLQANYAAAAVTEQNMSTTLERLIRGRPLTCAANDTLRTAFERMHAAQVGSIVIVELQRQTHEQGTAGETVCGILTLTDLIGRVILPGVALDAPVSSVMTRNVVTLDATDTAADATVLMAEHGIRHLPVMTRDGGVMRVRGVVSERDLFALQRMSVRSLAAAIRRADEVPALAAIAADIRRLSFHLVAQGVSAAQLTRLISHLNDQLTTRLLQLACTRFAVAENALCWIALGSEGRCEQTIATDQDNGIVFDPARADRARLLELAVWANDALATAGFPLCKGGIMARNPKWCLPQDEWQALFADWIDRGSPQALLDASIFFDLRGLFGDLNLAVVLRANVVQAASRNARFLKQMADNALRNRAGASSVFDKIFGAGIGETLVETFGGDEGTVDLKLNGTVPFVDAARIWALAAGITDTNTSERLRQLVARGKLPERDAAGWIAAFEFLQLARLRAQHRRAQDGVVSPETNPNLIALGDLSPLDRRILKESVRQARKLQQRLALDYPG
jgi:CBS domain-containing protein